MQLDKIYFHFIKNGVKLYEIRVYDEKRRNLKLLDIVTFYEKKTRETFEAEITELAYFDNFSAAISEVEFKQVLPNANSLDEAVGIYENFPGYKSGAAKYGVLRMKFKLLH